MRSPHTLARRALHVLAAAEEKEAPNLFDLQRSLEATRELLRRSEQHTSAEREAVQALFAGNRRLRERLAASGAGLTWAASELTAGGKDLPVPPEVGQALLQSGIPNAARARVRVVRAWKHGTVSGTDPRERALRLVPARAEEATLELLTELEHRYQDQVGREGREYVLVSPWLRRYGSGGEAGPVTAMTAHTVAELAEPGAQRWRAARGTLLLAPPAVADVLTRRWGGEATGLGPEEEGDTEATLETMVRLLETSDGALGEPVAALQAARLLLR